MSTKQQISEQIIALFYQGYTNKEIAEALNISTRRVERAKMAFRKANNTTGKKLPIPVTEKMLSEMFNILFEAIMDGNTTVCVKFRSCYLTPEVFFDRTYAITEEDAAIKVRGKYIEGQVNTLCFMRWIYEEAAKIGWEPPFPIEDLRSIHEVVKKFKNVEEKLDNLQTLQ